MGASQVPYTCPGMDAWDGIGDLAAGWLPALGDIGIAETCDTEEWHQSLAFRAHGTARPVVHENVARQVRVVFKGICDLFPDMRCEDLMDTWDCMLHDGRYTQIPDASAKVLAAGSLYMCVLWRYGEALSTKSICAVCSVTSPTARKAVALFKLLFPDPSRAAQVCPPTS